VSSLRDGVVYDNVGLLVGNFWQGVLNATNTVPSFTNWELASSLKLSTALYAAHSNSQFAIGQYGAVGSAAEFEQFNFMNQGVTPYIPGRFQAEAYWDSAPKLYSANMGVLNPNPSRIVGLKVALQCTSSPLNLSGSIRGGDNGTLATSARPEAVTMTDLDGTLNPTTTNDVFDQPWYDGSAGLTLFRNDPRVPECGAIRREVVYEFAWVPTDESQIQYEDEAQGGTWTLVSTGPHIFAGNAGPAPWPCNVIRRGPCIIIVLSGLGSLAQSFQVRATMSVEHTVTPQGNGNIYDYSRRAPWFPLPWDKLASLPVRGVGVGNMVVNAGREADEDTGDGMRVGPQPSISRAIASFAGLTSPAVYGPGTVNPNGAYPVIGLGAEAPLAVKSAGPKASWIRTAGQGAWNAAKAVGRLATHAAQYGIEHVDAIEKLVGITKGSNPAPPSIGSSIPRWPGAYVEEVAEGALMLV
jgi:hypothetical protein